MVYIFPDPGAEAISEERRRQIQEEGYSYDHDDQFKKAELIAFAFAYACHHFNQKYANDICPKNWDFKPSDDPVRNLEKAGALIAAEIDRLLRARGEFYPERRRDAEEHA